MPMKKEIKLLRKVQRLYESDLYPGHPGVDAFIIDVKENKIYRTSIGKDSSRPKDFDKEFSTICKGLMYRSLGSDLLVKPSFIQNGVYGNIEDVNKSQYEDYFIDSVEAVKLFFGINFALIEHKGENVFIFAFANYAEECSGTFVFKNIEEIKDFVKEATEYE